MSIEIMRVTDTTPAILLPEYVRSNWGVVFDVFLKTFELGLSVSSRLPRTFVLLRGADIAGFYQLTESEPIKSTDYGPWISRLFIDPQERGRGLGFHLLHHGKVTAGELGYRDVYLASDHIGYYERAGFREIGLTVFETGRPVKIFRAGAVR